MTLEEFIESIYCRIDQCESLVFNVDHLIGHCPVVEDTVPQILKKLHISRRYDLHEHMTVLFGGGPAPPGLEDISFADFDIRLSQLCLSGLRSLELICLSGTSEADFVHIIHQSPTLETIRLRQAPLNRSEDLASLQLLLPIQLPSL
ncbi:hypothetical protein FRB90_009947, partial [Tulasnella sp. 427]